MRGKVYNYQGEVTYHFEYGPTTSYGSRTPEVVWKRDEGTEGRVAGADVGPWITVKGLLPGTTYHHRLVANDTPGQDVEFTTPEAEFEVIDSSSMENGVDLDDFDDGGAPFDMLCAWIWEPEFRGEPSGSVSEERVDCPKITVTATLPNKRVAKILRFRSREIFDGVLKEPKIGIDEEAPRGAPDDVTSFHMKLASTTRRKLRPVAAIDAVKMQAVVTAPDGQKVKLRAISGWGERKTPGGIICPSKDIHLSIRPHNRKPYCPGPGGYGGEAGPDWYKG